MENKTQILIAVVITAIVCIAGTYALAGGSNDNSNQTITATGSTTIQPVMAIFAEEYGKATGVTVNVSGGGSGVGENAARNAKPGDAVIGNMSTDVSVAGKQAGLVATAIGKDAVVVIADKNAGVTQLTVEQLAQIYYGQITNWNQVGGNNLKISPILREDGSGTKDCIDTAMSAALGISKNDLIAYEDGAGYSQQSSTGSMLTQSESVSGAIGYVNLSDIPLLKKTVVVAISDGTDPYVVPSEGSVLDTTSAGHYPISRTLYLVTNGDPSNNSTVNAFINWILSPQGQKILEEQGGFVPLAPTQPPAGI